MKKIVIAAALLFTLFSCNNKEKSGSLVFVSWGGSYQAAQDSAYIKGFQDSTGIKVDQVTYSGELSRISEMVNSGKPDWDVVSVTQEMFGKGADAGIYEDLNYRVIDTAGFLPGSVQKNGIAHLIFSTVLAYNSDFYQGKERPVSWKDFWDVSKFPAARALNDGPVGNLEFALLADGVSPDKLYPLDIDRAFKKLDEIKKFIKVWWKAGQQPIQLLANNEVQLSTAYNGRVAKAQSDGEPVAIEWNGGMLEPEYFVIPKGASNAVNANKFIAYATKPGQQAKFVTIIPYGPTNLSALNKLPDDLITKLPDSKPNLAGQFLVDGKWWSAHYDSLTQRWNEWKLKN